MNWLRNLFSKMFKRKSQWDELPYGKPATVEDEFARLNNER